MFYLHYSNQNIVCFFLYARKTMSNTDTQRKHWSTKYCHWQSRGKKLSFCQCLRRSSGRGITPKDTCLKLQRCNDLSCWTKTKKKCSTCFMWEKQPKICFCFASWWKIKGLDSMIFSLWKILKNWEKSYISFNKGNLVTDFHIISKLQCLIYFFLKRYVAFTTWSLSFAPNIWIFCLWHHKASQGWIELKWNITAIGTKELPRRICLKPNLPNAWKSTSELQGFF